MVKLLTDQLQLNLVTLSDMSLALGGLKVSFVGVEVELKERVKSDKALEINDVIELYTRLLEEYATRKVRPCLDKGICMMMDAKDANFRMHLHGAPPGTTHGPRADCHRRGQRIDGLGYSRREGQEGPSQLLCTSGL